MVAQLASLRVTADFDASGYRAGMAQKVAADEAGTASSTALGAALARQDVAADNTGGSVGRLSRTYIDGYGSSAKFYGSVAALQRQMELGNVSAERAELIYTGLVAKFGMVASAAEAAVGGNVNLAAVIERVNAVTDTTVVGLTGMGAAFDIARLKAEQAGQVFQSTLNQSFGIGAGGKSARDSASVFEAAAKEADQFAAKAASLRAQIDPLAAAQDRYNAELAEYAALASRGVITSNELAAAQGMAGQKFATAAANIKAGGVAGTFLGAGDAAKLSAFQVQNLSFQMQDVGQAILTGQPLFRTFIQQGSQMAQIFGPGVGVAGAMKALGQGLLQYVTNPINLAFLALAGLAAGVGAFFTLIGSGGETAAEALKRHKDLIDEIGKAYSKASDDARSFGFVETDVLKSTAILNQIQMTNELTKARKDLAAVSTQSLFQIGNPNGLLGGIGMTNPFANWNVPRGFLEDARKFREELAQGSGDVLEYRKHLGELGQAFPTSENLAFIASEMKATDASAKLTEDQRKLAAMMRFAAGEATAADRAILGLVAAMTAAQEVRPGPLTGSPQSAQRDSMLAYGKELGVDYSVDASARQRDLDILIDKTRQLNEIDIRGLSARSPAAKAAIAAERERVSLIGQNINVAEAEVRISNAATMALASAQHSLSEAARARKLAYDETLRSAQLDIDLVGKSASETARLRKEYELMAQLRQEASTNGIAISQQDIAAVERQSQAYGELVGQLEKVQDAQAAQSFFARSLFDAAKGADSLGDAMGKLAGKIADAALEGALLGTGPLASLLGTKSQSGGILGMLFNGIVSGASGGVSGGLYHSGGIVGTTPVAGRYVHPAYFDNAPRMHGGGTLGADERPIIGKVGEVVGWPSQMRKAYGGGGSSVTFNQTINVQGSSGDAASDARYIEALQRQMESAARKVIREEMRPRGAFDQF